MHSVNVPTCLWLRGGALLSCNDRSLLSFCGLLRPDAYDAHVGHAQLNVSAPSEQPTAPAAPLPPGVDCQAAVGTDTAQVPAETWLYRQFYAVIDHSIRAVTDARLADSSTGLTVCSPTHKG